MATPTPTRRITRSQAASLAPLEKKVTTRVALVDISNDSPIAGVAADGSKTSSSLMGKKKITIESGEKLIRDHVKSLLGKAVEEDEKSAPEIAIEEGKDEEVMEEAAEVETKTVELSDDTSLSVEQAELTKEDSSSEEEDYIDDDYYDDVEESEDIYCDALDELCNGIKNISVTAEVTKFEGKHTRFVYNSDDEIEGQEEVDAATPLSPSKTLLKGLPVPEGKHLRFPENEED